MVQVSSSSRSGIRRSVMTALGLAIAVVLVSTLAPVAPVQAMNATLVNPAEVTSISQQATISEVELNAIIARAWRGKWIEIRLASQRLYAWQNGRIVMSSLISSGIWRYPTRRGYFRIYRKYRSTRMRGPGYNLPNVPWTMYYSGSYAIHGAYWHHNFGHPMSHGCINLPVPFSRRLFAWAPVGTLVVIH